MTLAPGEHPTLPTSRFELHQAQDEQRTRTGKVTRPGHPAYARAVIGFHGVIQTAQPDRLDALADELHQLADALRAAHATGAPGQTALELGAAS